MDMENPHNRGGGSTETRETSFDVVLSVGPDTRRDFVDHLCRSLHQAGIRVFTDEGLTLGESFERSLTAIRHSKIAIPILSKNYASSPQCLGELAQIVECHETMGQTIMPVFLDVKPSDVWNRSGVYGKAIFEYIRRGENAENRRKWTKALIRVGSIPGLESDGSRTRAAIIKELVANVLRELKRYFVGIEDHVERFSVRNCPSVIQPPDSISRVIAAESSSKVEVSKPANTKHSSSKVVERKYEGNEGRIVNIRNNNDELMKLNSLPDGGIGWHKIGKIFVSRNEIAKGSNGTIVLEGMYEDRHVAVKRLVRTHRDFASNEIQILIASDRHENIVRYYGVEYDLDFVYLALERCTCSLDDLIQVNSDSSNNQDPASMDDSKIKLESIRGMMHDVNLWLADGYPSPLLLKLMRDVVSGLVHLHNLGIIHRDLKPQNVLITKNRLFGAQLSDMGISRCLLEDGSSLGYHATGCGTSGWRAPEQLLHGGRQTRQMDLFSLGCVLFFCVTCGKHPFGEHLERDFNIAKSKMDLSWVEFIPEAHDLFSHLLNRDPKLRPKASEVLHHPFFWNSEMRLSFLGDVSDKVELEAKAPNSDLLKTLENTAQPVFDGNWDDKIEPEVMADLRKRRKYDGSRVRDLLRAVRNKRSHYTEAPKEIKEILGSVPDGLDAYFARRFPRLLIESYRVVSRICKEEECFQKYSLFPPWPTPTEVPSSSQQGRP